MGRGIGEELESVKKRNVLDDISRRSFLKGSMVAAASMGVAGMIGASSAGQALASENSGSASSGASQASEAQPLGDPTETVSADVCIIGAGGAGLAAGAHASELGLKVIILEKDVSEGGNFIFSEGCFAIDTPETEANPPETRPDRNTVYHQSMTYHHFVNNGDLVRKFFDQSSVTIAWLKELGCQFQPQALATGIGNHCWHLHAPEEGEERAETVVRKLKECAENNGAEIRFSTTGRELIMNDGKVAGVKAVDGAGAVIEIDAPVVITAGGGFMCDAGMLDTYCQTSTDVVYYFGKPTGTGEGVKMGLAAGGRMDRYAINLDGMGNQCPGTIYGDIIYSSATAQPTLWVNERGERYINEDVWYQNFNFCGQARMRQKRAFSILSRKNFEYFQDNGLLVDVGVVYFAGQPVEGLLDAIDEFAASSEYVYQADTIEELAQKMGVDPTTLAETVKSNNEYCAQGLDPDFGRDPKYMLATGEEGPFYAFEYFDGCASNSNGLVVNTDVAVLDANDEPIPGLYACGADNGGLYGDTYDVSICPGSLSGWALHSGYIAAESAGKYLA